MLDALDRIIGFGNIMIGLLVVFGTAMVVSLFVTFSNLVPSYIDSPAIKLPETSTNRLSIVDEPSYEQKVNDKITWFVYVGDRDQLSTKIQSDILALNGTLLTHGYQYFEAIVPENYAQRVMELNDKRHSMFSDAPPFYLEFYNENPSVHNAGPMTLVELHLYTDSFSKTEFYYLVGIITFSFLCIAIPLTVFSIHIFRRGGFRAVKASN